MQTHTWPNLTRMELVTGRTPMGTSSTTSWARGWRWIQTATSLWWGVFAERWTSDVGHSRTPRPLIFSWPNYRQMESVAGRNSLAMGTATTAMQWRWITTAPIAASSSPVSRSGMSTSVAAGSDEWAANLATTPTLQSFSTWM